MPWCLLGTDPKSFNDIFSVGMTDGLLLDLPRLLWIIGLYLVVLSWLDVINELRQEKTPRKVRHVMPA